MQVMTHPITADFPPDAYAILERKAKSEKKTLAQTVVEIIEDALDYIDDEEDMRLSAICDERLATSDGKYMSSDEFWKRAHEVPYNP